jgi:hypothetical protein
LKGVIHLAVQTGVRYSINVVEGIIRITDKPATPDLAYNSKQPDPSRSSAPYRIYNIGNHQPVEGHVNVFAYTTESKNSCVNSERLYVKGADLSAPFL